MVHRSKDYSYGLKDWEKRPWLQGGVLRKILYCIARTASTINSIDELASRHQRFNNHLHSMAQYHNCNIDAEVSIR